MKPWEVQYAPEPEAPKKPWEVDYGVEPEQQQRPGDFTGNLAYDLRKRATAADEIRAMRQSGQISKPEEIFQLAGKVGAGTVADISGNILASGLKTADKLTGGIGSAGISKLMGAVGSLPSGSGLSMAEQLPRDIGRVGAAYGEFAEQNPRAATNIESAANLATVLPGMIAGGEAVIGAAKGVKSSLKRPPIPKAEEIRDQASQLYKLAEQQGGVLRPQFMDDFINNISTKAPQTALGRAMEGKSPVAEMIDNLQAFRGKPMTLAAAQEADEILGALAYKNVDNFGKLDNVGRQFLDMQTNLRRMIDKADQSMFVGGKQGFETAKEARKYWATQMRMRDVERIIENAQYFEQPSTAIKTGFRTLLRNGDRLKGYTVAEVNAMKKAASTGIVPGFFKLAGSGLVPIAGGAAGVATGGAGGALAAIPAYALQQGAKGVANTMQMGRAQNVSREIAKRVAPTVAAPSTGANLANLGLQTGKALAPGAAADVSMQGLDELTLQQMMRLSPEEFNRRYGRK